MKPRVPSNGGLSGLPLPPDGRLMGLLAEESLINQRLAKLGRRKAA
jgi:hypothetical protein